MLTVGQLIFDNVQKQFGRGRTVILINRAQTAECPYDAKKCELWSTSALHKNINSGLGCSLVVEHELSIHGALGFILTTTGQPISFKMGHTTKQTPKTRKLLQGNAEGNLGLGTVLRHDTKSTALAKELFGSQNSYHVV